MHAVLRYRTSRLVGLLFLGIGTWVFFANKAVFGEYPTAGYAKSVGGRKILSVPAAPFMTVQLEQGILGSSWLQSLQTDDLTFDIRGGRFVLTMLEDSIQATIDPASWESMGGMGVIRPSVVRDRALLSIGAPTVTHLKIQAYLDQANAGPETPSDQWLQISDQAEHEYMRGVHAPHGSGLGGIGGGMMRAEDRVSPKSTEP